MQRDEVVEFLGRIDAHLRAIFKDQLGGKKFELRIFGKSALLLAGLIDSIGTVDIDLLRVERQTSPEVSKEVILSLKDEFGKSRLAVNGYYLEFVEPAIVFLSQKSKWVPFESQFETLLISYLDPVHGYKQELMKNYGEAQLMFNPDSD